MIRHVAGIAEIVDDIDAAVRFYRDILGLEVEHESGSGYGTVKIQGLLHFGLWSRVEAARATFGDASATNRIPLGFSVGFEVDGVEEDSSTMQSRGWLLRKARRRSLGGRKQVDSSAPVELCARSRRRLGPGASRGR